MDVKIDLNELAEKLGVASEYLIQIFAKRWWTVWVDVGIEFVGMLIMGLLCYYLWKYTLLVKKRVSSLDDWLPYLFGSILVSIILFTMSACFSAKISQAVRATASPEAYAVDQILRRVK